MKTLTATQARKDIYRLLDETSDTHQPIQITGKRSNAILISEEDWPRFPGTYEIFKVRFYS